MELHGSPAGEYPPGDRATCFFSTSGVDTAILTFEVLCNNPSEASCIAPLAISIGEEGWISPEFLSEIQQTGRTQRRVPPEEIKE
jgi:hypothetical protein